MYMSLESIPRATQRKKPLQLSHNICAGCVSKTILHFLAFKQVILRCIYEQTADVSEHFEFTTRGTDLVLMTILQSSPSIELNKRYSTALGGRGKHVEADMSHGLYFLKPRPTSI